MGSSTDDPLAEVFGYKTDDFSDQAERFRSNTLCPFNNKVPDCTKDKANDPLGVCSIKRGDNQIITCPVRFRENWLIAEHAANFFFEEGTRWTSIMEMGLNDKDGKSAGKIDLVPVAYDDDGVVQNFGALEVQAVYITGNVRNPFERYMDAPEDWSDINWRDKANNFPTADWYSSEKRLVTQLRRKGSILNQWDRKQAVALQSAFYETLPDLPEVAEDEADMAWFLYDLRDPGGSQQYTLELDETIYTRYEPTLKRIATMEAGDVGDFVEKLQNRLDEQLDGDDEDSHPPEAPTLRDLL